MKVIKYTLGVLGLLISLSLPTTVQASSDSNLFPKVTGVNAVVSGVSVNFRSYPSRYGKIVSSVSNERVQVLGQNDEWYKVELDGEQGWIHKDYVDVFSEFFVPHSRVIGEEIVEYGKQFIGTPYIWGGEDLLRGVDCSGLTMRLYEDFDIDISRVSYMQVNDGLYVSKQNLRPGDLVFFDTSGVNNGNISHVGMFIKDDKFLHADSTNGVMISSLDSNYYTRNYVAGCRILTGF